LQDYGLNWSMQLSKSFAHHFGIAYAGQCVEWLPTDTQENFQQLMQEPQHREYFARLGWDQPGAITYRFNSHGFRCDEFDGGPYLLALGCSYTVGIGLPVEETWPHKAAKKLGLRCANLAWGGYSADTCFRLAEHWVPKLRPSLVVMLTPPRHRLELMLDPKQFDMRLVPFEVFMPGSLSKHYAADDHYLKHWFVEEENARINQVKNCLALRQLCADRQIPCQIYHSDVVMGRSREEIGYARDHMHGGPPAHTELAQMIEHEYKK